MPNRRPRPDWLTSYTNFLTKAKFAALETIIFIGFLLWLWGKVKHDFEINFGTTPVAASSMFVPSVPSHSETATPKHPPSMK